MQQDPPRVVPPSEFGAARPNVGCLIAVGFGALLILCLICSGSILLFYRTRTADDNFGGSFSDLHEPIGGAMPERLRNITQSALPSHHSEANELAALLSNDDPAVELDISRFVTEAQRSNLSSGAINPFTTILWAARLGEAVTKPDLGQYVSVLDFQWLIAEKEARAVVAGFASNGNCKITVIYLSRRESRWRIFDYRDLLLPLSESQYWAIYAGLDERVDTLYSDFTHEAYKTGTDDTLSQTVKAQRLLAAYARYKFPQRYQPLAQDTLCSWLVALGAQKELASIVANLNPSEFAGAWLYMAQSAAWSGETDKAFEYLGHLIARVGWHPQAAELASEIAETQRQKHLAALWLQRSVLIAPKYSRAVEQFFALADREQIVALFRAICRLEQPDKTAIAIFDAFYNLSAVKIQWLLEIVEQNSELQQASNHLKLKLAIAQEDHSEVSRLAGSLDFQSTDEALAAQVQSHKVQIAILENTLEASFDHAFDRRQFIELLLQQLMYQNPKAENEATLTFLKSLPADEELLLEPNAVVALSHLERKLGQHSAAFDRMLRAFHRLPTEFLSAEPDYSVCQIVQELGAAAMSSDRWRELIGEFDNEVLFLTCAATAPDRPLQLNTLVDWYQQQPGHSPVWLNYYRAKLAFTEGDWPTADHYLMEAIASLKEDSRLAQNSLPPLVNQLATSDDEYDEYDFDYVEYDESESNTAYLLARWTWKRFHFAARFDELDKLVDQLHSDTQFDLSCFDQLETFFSSASIQAQEKILARLTTVTSADFSTRVAALQAQLDVATGRFNRATDHYLDAANKAEPDSIEQMTALRASGSLILQSGDLQRLKRMLRTSKGRKLSVYAGCVAAALRRDVPALSVELERLSDGDWNSRFDLSDLAVLNSLRDAEGLVELLAKKPIRIHALMHSKTSALVLSDQDAQQTSQAMEASFTEAGIDFQTLAAARFQHASSAYKLTTGHGSLIVTVRDAREDTFTRDESVAEPLAQARSIVGFAWHNFNGNRNLGSEFLRLAISDLLPSLTTAIAFYSNETSSLFYGLGWQKRCAENWETGVDPIRPLQVYSLTLDQSTPTELEIDGLQFLILRVGDICELVPIERIKRDTPWNPQLARTLEPSILLPQLPVQSTIEY